MREPASPASLPAAPYDIRLSGLTARWKPDGPDVLSGADLWLPAGQRLALARVLLADFPVAILDEPAEHLNDEAADALTADLLAATTERTVLLITHCPVSAAQVDQVLRLTGGGLAEVPPA